MAGFYILGQDPAQTLLKAALRLHRVTTAYAFVGPPGVGRGLTARWFAQALTCERGEPDPCGFCAACHRLQEGNHPDFLWVEPTYLHQGKLLTAQEAAAQDLQRRSPPQIRLEQIQGIRVFSSRRPLLTERSIIVLDGAETLAESAANALLKTLEEPGHALLILIIPSVADLLPTLISRCQVIPFRRLSPQHMTEILSKHGHLQVSASILALAQGSPGVALTALQQWEQIAPELRMELEQWPTSLIKAFQVGRKVAKTLDIPGQLWLITYLQHHFWQDFQRGYVHQLEQMRKQLLAFVQPQLVWEMGLAAGFQHSKTAPTEGAVFDEHFDVEF